MSMRGPFVIACALVLSLAGCASAPLSSEGVDAGVTVAGVRDAPDAHIGSTVIWGGVIARSHNLPERTRLEVVAYPLGERSQRPLIDGASPGRFRVYIDGYLETAVYAPGRQITVRGRVEGVEQGRIDDAEYDFPVLDGGKLHLWPQARATQDSRVHFGFGVILGN